jgi:hypothetical protein
MMYHLAKPIRRAFAVVLLGALVGSAWKFAAEPLIAHVGDLKDRIEQERMVAGRLLGVSTDDAVRRDLELQAKTIKADRLFLDGESEAIRMADLQSHLATIAAANGIRLRSSRSLPSRERYDLRLVGLQLQLAAPLERLQKFLLDVEQYNPWLYVASLQITPLTVARVVDDEVGVLEARLDVLAVVPRQKERNEIREPVTPGEAR